jgi:hypothetical protein
MAANWTVLLRDLGWNSPFYLAQAQRGDRYIDSYPGNR